MLARAVPAAQHYRRQAVSKHCEDDAKDTLGAGKLARNARAAREAHFQWLHGIAQDAGLADDPGDVVSGVVNRFNR